MKLSLKIPELVSKNSIIGYNVIPSLIDMDSIRMTSLASFAKRYIAVFISMQLLNSSQTPVRAISRHISKAKAGIQTQEYPQVDLIKEVSIEVPIDVCIDAAASSECRMLDWCYGLLR